MELGEFVDVPAECGLGRVCDGYEVHGVEETLWALVLLELCAGVVSGGTDTGGVDMFEYEEISSLKLHYGSLAGTIYSLFKAITGGISWGEVADPLVSYSVWLGLLFSFYIMFTVFAVLI